MYRFISSSVAIMTLLFITALTGLAQSWDIDSAHSSAQFSVRHLMVSNTRGEFGKFTGTVNYDSKDLSKLSVEAVIDATSINTHEPKRDEHLKSADFFDVAKFPTITFKSKRVEQLSKTGFKLVGDLTMHGVTKEVVLDVTLPSPEIKDQRGLIHTGATATTRVNRKDFGILWNRVLDSGGVAVSEEVAISLELELVKKADTASAK